jgi:hypothetical protein
MVDFRLSLQVIPGFCQEGYFNMNAGKYALAGLTMTLVLAGCASTSTKSDSVRRTTQQRQMSGTDSNYPSSGVFSGESGRITVYSSEEAKARKERDARLDDELLPSTIEPGSEEAKEYKQWKAEQDEADFEAWKEAQAEKEQQSAEAAADTD